MTSDSDKNEYVAALEEINFKFWKQVSEGSIDDKLSNSAKAMLKTIKGVEGESFLDGITPEFHKKLEKLIEGEINDFDVNKPDYKKLAIIFDLIHVWGGKMGRGPYVISKSRLNPKKWQDEYLAGAKLAKLQKPEEALEASEALEAIKEFEKIKGIGISFASKHLRFWSNKYPVLDARISLIFGGRSNPNRKSYEKILPLLEDLRNFWRCSPIKAENIVYTFSAYYFLNDRLEFNNAPKPKCCKILEKQQKIAQKIVKLATPS